MNTPVSFELAKLLKEKGFVCKESSSFWMNGFSYLKKDYNQITYQDKDNVATLAEVVMWLYEKHGVWIACHRYNGKLPFGCIISDNTGDVDVKGGYPNPTKAYEAAIEHCLNNLI